MQNQSEPYLKDSAAVTIKAGFAGFRKRQESRSKLTNLPDQEKIKQAAAKQKSDPKKDANMADKSEKVLAGMHIRAGFRGHFTRQQPKSDTRTDQESKVKDGHAKKDQGKLDGDQGAAATQIRAAFRGHMTRQEKAKRKV